MEALPKDIANKIKYMSLEHPCAKMIKDFFKDYETYWSNIVKSCGATASQVIALNGEGNFCRFIFLHWQKVLAAKGKDILSTKKKLSKTNGLRALMFSVYGYMQMQTRRDEGAPLRVQVYL